MRWSINAMEREQEEIPDTDDRQSNDSTKVFIGQ